MFAVLVHTFQTVEIPSMKVQKKVKSMQMFRKPVERILQVMIRNDDEDDDDDIRLKKKESKAAWSNCYYYKFHSFFVIMQNMLKFCSKTYTS